MKQKIFPRILLWVYISYIDNRFSLQIENSLSTYEPCACVVIYSIIDLQSFKVAEETMSYLWRFGYSKAKSVILVGNKVDLERSRIISTEGKGGVF